MRRSTITGWLSASGQQFADWSAAYRLFDQERMDVSKIFAKVRQQTVSHIDAGQALIFGHMDDTLIRKRGKKIFGTRWLRDPLGPAFHTNFIWGQRFIQLSLSLFHQKMGAIPARSIPVDFYHCPTVIKPKKNSQQSEWEQYRETQKKLKLSVIGTERIALLRKGLDKDGHNEKILVMSVDGSYTNETAIKNLPEKVALIGRIRKDTKLYGLPERSPKGAGRRKVYGDRLPTPEQVRQSDDYPWQQVKAWAAGKVHDFDVKVVPTVRWRKAGNKNLQLVIIRPIGYRPTKKSRLLYRGPAYLICTDPGLSIETLLQAYLWRWDIEVNFKEEKSLLGCGQAQVRKKDACQSVPAFVTAIYALLLLAASKTENQELPRPKWNQYKNDKRTTTGDILNHFRAINWANNAKINFSSFVNIIKKQRSGENLFNPALNAIFYARN